jgi:hypothetical protein
VLTKTRLQAVGPKGTYIGAIADEVRELVRIKVVRYQGHSLWGLFLWLPKAINTTQIPISKSINYEDVPIYDANLSTLKIRVHNTTVRYTERSG